MRLLRTLLGGDGRLQLIEAWDERIPPYAILSHTWSTTASDEVLYRDILEGTSSQKPAYDKVVGAMNLAHIEGYEYIWIDTLCIEKSSSADLSEAINSMYAYYGQAGICYVYLSDVTAAESLADARWWTRGWTLQELLAPSHAVFYTLDWQCIGGRDELVEEISSISGIQRHYLVDSSRDILWTASIAKRMSWAATRKTGRSEDMAYSLLGLFSVNMPLLYGEGGKRAFLRLQEEIMKSTDDHTIFAWVDSRGSDEPHGLLADSPLAFAHTGQYQPYFDHGTRRPYAMTNRGLQMSLPLTRKGPGEYFAALECPPNADSSRGNLAVVLKRWPGTEKDADFQRYSRIECSTLTAIGTRGDLQNLYVPQATAQVAGVRMYPDMFFRLHQLPAPYKLISVRYDQQLPNDKPGADRFTKMSKSTEFLMNLPMSAKPNTVSAILLMESTTHAAVFAVLLGTSASSEAAFDIKLFPTVALTRETALEAQFTPVTSGSWVILGSYRFKIDFKEVIQVGQVICNVHIEAVSNRGRHKAELSEDGSLILQKSLPVRIASSLFVPK
ncbi:hypothetical protein CKM354_001027700 [Cercospora kikuchii]|uniref:Heterokaryon incompatibility domain-containing protein n=1 Tax=Cercospora kikuchii TaxID=84275 RepID=A0A9P3FGZ0_9PEZI|nr:uncharacterized protein CKM354_001027700 [Cercospora kikuchii]GIZ47178.1 hypothetical protein CKM354_001027700 [Cercospora kikuchii]